MPTMRLFRAKSLGRGRLRGAALRGWMVGGGGVGAEQMNGLMMAGLYLKAEDYFHGVGTGAYTRISEQHGVTIGLLNVADELHGAQIGLLNWAGNNDTFKLLPLLNLHRD